MKYKSIILASIGAMLLLSCSKHEEIEFSGTVIDIRSCGSIEISADRNPAHLVALDSPSNVGGNYEGKENVVVLYEPTKHIRVDDRIHGTFYFDDDYSSANCSWRNTDYNLPEGVFVETVVD